MITTHPLTTARTSIARFLVTVPVASSLLLAGPIGLLCDLGLFGLPSLVRDLCLPFSTTSRLGARTTVSESGSDAFNTLINGLFQSARGEGFSIAFAADQASAVEYLPV